MSSTKIYLRFSIYGDEFNPDEVTEILGLNPTQTHFMNEVIPPRVNSTRIREIRYKETNWCIEIDYRESLNVNDLIDELMAKIGNKTEELRRICKTFYTKTLFDFCVKIENGEAPAMCFSAEFIKFVADIGARIDVDTYVY